VKIKKETMPRSRKRASSASRDTRHSQENDESRAAENFPTGGIGASAGGLGVFEALIRQSEEKYRAILENIQEGYFEVDLAGNFTFFNDSLCLMHGYSRAELIGMNNRQYMDKETAKKVYQAFNSVYKTGRPIKKFDWEITRKDGTKSHVGASVSLLKDASGNPCGFRGIIRDITEQQIIFEKLRLEEQRFRALADQSSDIILLINREGIITYENPAVKILGITPEERIGASAFERVHPDDLKLLTDAFSAFFSDSVTSPQKAEIRIRHKDGSWRNFEIAASGLSRDNIVESIIINLHDITERKRAESFLRKSEARYRLLAEHMKDFVWLMDMNLKWTYISPSIEKFFGYTLEELVKLPLDKLLAPTSFRRVMQAFSNEVSKAMKEPPPSSYNILMELECRSKEGLTSWVECTLSFILDADGKPVSIMGEARDITERILADEEVNKLASVVRYSTELVSIASTDGKMIFLNETGAGMLGIDPDKTSDYFITDVIPDNFLPTVRQEILPALMAGYSWEGELQYRNLRTGVLTDVQAITFSIKDVVTGRPLYLANISSDISQRKAAEKALKESEQRYLELSIIDDLTRLYNFRHFNSEIGKEIERANRYEQPLTLLLMDLDKFKNFNDTYGHPEGDVVLSRLGQVIKRCVRDPDSAYRYGGEEFTIILPMTTGEEGLVTAERIQKEFKAEVFTPASGKKVRMTISIGVSQYQQLEEMTAFVKRADKLMYKAKKSGRDKICSDIKASSKRRRKA
jgi:diguanylate cyclase (GGDEF)-like protein/PAS domain S-box-containing protein